jgi:hypothetical protein
MQKADGDAISWNPNVRWAFAASTAAILAAGTTLGTCGSRFGDRPSSARTRSTGTAAAIAASTAAAITTIVNRAATSEQIDE